MARLSIDTSFLIDLQRERSVGRQADGAAHAFLRRTPDAELFLSAVALGEYAEGFTGPDDPQVRVVREGHTLLDVDADTALVYARVARELRRAGTLIGANDLWIGCTSLRHELPVVTANAEHFRRIPGLAVLSYRFDHTGTPG